MDSLDRDIAGLARHWLVQGAFGLLLLGVLAIAAMGGFREAQSPQSLPRIAQGQAASNGAYRLTPVCAWLTDRMPGRDYPDPGLRYLVLRLRAVNQMDSARPGLEQDVVWVPQGSGASRPADAVLRSDDHSFQVNPQPRLPTAVDLVWKLSDRNPIRQPVTWGVLSRTYVAQGYVSGEGGWLQRDPAFKIGMRAGAACPERGT
jgi:hypothetical protein